MTDVRREFGVSRKTGYKLFERYNEDGPAALASRARADPLRQPAPQPGRKPHGLLEARQAALARAKSATSSVRRLAGKVRVPATSATTPSTACTNVALSNHSAELSLRATEGCQRDLLKWRGPT